MLVQLDFFFYKAVPTQKLGLKSVNRATRSRSWRPTAGRPLLHHGSADCGSASGGRLAIKIHCQEMSSRVLREKAVTLRALLALRIFGHFKNCRISLRRPFSLPSHVSNSPTLSRPVRGSRHQSRSRCASCQIRGSEVPQAGLAKDAWQEQWPCLWTVSLCCQRQPNLEAPQGICAQNWWQGV